MEEVEVNVEFKSVAHGLVGGFGLFVDYILQSYAELIPFVSN